MCIFDPMWLCPFGQPEVVVVPIITIFSSRLMPGKMEVLGYILLLCDGSAAIVWLVKPLYLYLVECILWFRSVKSPFCLSKSMFFRLTQFELYFFSVAFVVAELLTEIRSWFFLAGILIFRICVWLKMAIPPNQQFWMGNVILNYRILGYPIFNETHWNCWCFFFPEVWGQRCRHPSWPRCSRRCASGVCALGTFWCGKKWRSEWFDMWAAKNVDFTDFTNQIIAHWRIWHDLTLQTLGLY